MDTIIVSAFPCCGKSYYAKGKEEVLDLESSSYSWLEYNGHKLRNPDFPNNYIEDVILYRSQYKIIFVSSHISVRTALHVYGIPYYLVYPENTPECYNSWRERCYTRGTRLLWDSLLSECWTSLLTSCKYDKSPVKHIVLKSNEYIEDIVGEIDAEV